MGNRYDMIAAAEAEIEDILNQLALDLDGEVSDIDLLHYKADASRPYPVGITFTDTF